MSSPAGPSFLVTGASSGIGRAVAVHLAARGAVTLVGRDPERLEETIHQCQKVSSFSHLAKILDLSKSDSIETLSQDDVIYSGVVHSAGISKLIPFRNLSLEKMNEFFLINTFAPVLLTTALLRHRRLVKGSSVVFLSSTAAKDPEPALGLYSMSKSALEMGISSLALEYSERTGVRFNGLRPSHVETPLFATHSAILGAERLDEIRKKFPLGISNPQDLIPLIDFLLSEGSSKVTGSFFRIDGGRSCRPD